MVLQQKYAACQERNYDVISATSKQAGVPYVGEKQKTQYIYIHARGSCWIHWENPSLNPTCTLQCSPKVKPYINYVGVSKTKQEHDIPEVATPVVEVLVSGLQEGISLSIDATSWAIHLTSSACRTADVTRKVTEIDGREFDKHNVVTDGLLGSVIRKWVPCLAPLSTSVSKVIIKHMQTTNLNLRLHGCCVPLPAY